MSEYDLSWVDGACLNAVHVLAALVFGVRGFMRRGFDPVPAGPTERLALEGTITLGSYLAAGVVGLIRVLPPAYALGGHIAKSLESESVVVTYTGAVLAVAVWAGGAVVGAAGTPVAAYLAGRAGRWVVNRD